MAQGRRPGDVELRRAEQVGRVEDGERDEGGGPEGRVGEEVRLRRDERRDGGVAADAEDGERRPVEAAEERDAEAGEQREGLGVGDEGVGLRDEDQAQVGAHALPRQAHRRARQPQRVAPHLRPHRGPRPAERVEEGPAAVAAPEAEQHLRQGRGRVSAVAGGPRAESKGGTWQ